jgi:hypothetical protein
MPDDLVVRDGRIDEEKVSELRAIGGETESLDFKRTANLQLARTKLNIVKDIVSLANTGGGFLIVGCDDQGNLARDQAPIVVDQWEPANLMGLVAKYVSAPISLNARTHSISDWDIAIVAIQPSMRSLPVPFSSNGEWYDSDNKPHYEFRSGQIWVRSGPRNSPLDFHDWDRILADHDEELRERTRGENRNLIDQVLTAIRDDRSDEPDSGAGSLLALARRPSPLVPGLNWDNLDRSIDDALDAPRDTRIRRYVNELFMQITAAGADREQRQRAITELINLAIRSDSIDRSEQVELALATLHRAYGALDGPQSVRNLSGARDETITNYWLDIATRVIDLGAYFVRNQRWAEARLSYARTYSPEGVGDYVFQSWLRHAQVQGSRADLLKDEEGGEGGAVFLSRAREIAVEEPRLRPDLADVEPFSLSAAPDGRDLLLDSIAQFDALCSVMSEAGVTAGQAGHYPSFASLRTERALPIFELIGTDSSLRAGAFPGKSDQEVADALVRAIESAHQESWRSAGVWFVPTDGALGRFINANRSAR